MNRFWGKVNKTDTCWLWTGANNDQGYGQIRFGKQCKYVHRYSWELSNGPIPKGINVCHKCDTPLCINPDHLFLGTQKDNIRDMVSKGRWVNNCKPKLQEWEVLGIRWLLTFNDLDGVQLGKMFGVSKSAIYEIKHRKSWSHI